MTLGSLKNKFVKLKHFSILSSSRYFSSSYDFYFALALIVVIGLLIGHLWMHRYFNIDDVYIIYRYAENIAMGKGFVFNEGERVEGSSTFLWTVLLSIPLVFKADVVVASKILGAIATVALIVFVVLFVKQIIEDEWGKVLAVCAAILVSSATPVAVWAMSGMENSIYACLFIAGLYFYACFLKERSSGRTWPILFAFASLTRPEGFAFFFLVLMINLLRDIWISRSFVISLRNNLIHMLWFLTVFGPFIIFRWIYFKEIFPNSVIAKSTFQENLQQADIMNVPSMIIHGRGLNVVKAFLSKTFGFALIITLFPFLLKSARWINFILLMCTGGIFAVCMWNEGDWMPYSRLLVISIPILVISFILGLRLFFEIENKNYSGRWLALIITLGLTALCASNLFYLHKPEKHVYERHMALIDMGKKLNLIREKEDVLATDIAGRVAYFSKMRTIDLMGLCDSYIAHHGVNGGMYGKNDKRYAMAQKPTFIVVNNVHEWESWLQLSGFDENYWFVAMPNYSKMMLLMFVRKDRKNLDKVLKVFQAELVDPSDELKKIK